jgi:dethiobiotin synthetase/adenosylmethionine--8-amino-7-oxononanoate aminotransferase
VASATVFAAFEGGGTEGALLHGHSYSAHAAGCGAAAAALSAYVDPAANPALCTPDRCGNAACVAPCGRLVPLWCEEGLQQIANHPSVDRAFALGTVLAVHLATAACDGTGYASTAAAAVTARLREGGIYARPLGDAVYLMQGPTSDPAGGRAQGRRLQAALLAALG